MLDNSRLIVLVLVWLSCTIAVSQNELSPSVPLHSENQLIAEAIWTVIDFGAGYPKDTSKSFEKVNAAYPDSAKAAYWQGRFGGLAAQRSKALQEMAGQMKKLAEPQVGDSQIKEKSTSDKLRVIRMHAQRIRFQLQQRAKEHSSREGPQPFEESMLAAISRDPKLIAAWAALLGSSDEAIALAAADSWAELEPDNALPHYAKAVLINRKHKPNETIDVAVIEELEKGNRRPNCRAPAEPWPTDFSLIFPMHLPEADADYAGKTVTPAMFRKWVEFSLNLFDFSGTGVAFSDGAIRDLGSSILMESHKLPIHDDVRYLLAFASVGVHKVQSNRFAYGISGGSVERTLKRLETIAIDQHDFQRADEFNLINDYQVNVRRAIASAIKGRHDFSDSLQIDSDATAVMDAQRQAFSMPRINIRPTSKQWFFVADEQIDASNMRLFQLYPSVEGELIVQKQSQAVPAPDQTAEQLASRGFSTLGQVFNDMRLKNRQTCRNDGMLLVASSDSLAHEIALVCYDSGYLGERDSCIVAFKETDSINNFRVDFPYLGLRLAQIHSPIGSLKLEDLDKTSASANFAIVPWESLLDGNGQIMPTVVASRFPLLVTVRPAQQQQAWRLLKDVDAVAGIIVAESQILTGLAPARNAGH